MASSYYLSIVSSELKRTLTYRVEYWVTNILQIIVQLYLAYSLWGSIYVNQGGSVAGYSFDNMMLYYMLTGTLYYVFPGEMGAVSEDIYQGRLTKYLIYPVSYVGTKAAITVAQGLVSGMQFLIIVGLGALSIIPLIQMPFSIVSIVLGMVAVVFAWYLTFSIFLLVQLAAFWLDQCWTLQVMCYMTISIIGGRALPLDVFPLWAQSVIKVTPFPYLLDFPAQALLNRLSVYSWLNGMLVLITWSIVVTIAIRQLYKKGLRRYTGVGI